MQQEMTEKKGYPYSRNTPFIATILLPNTSLNSLQLLMMNYNIESIQV